MRFDTMTVGQLREFLGQFPDDLPVGLACPSGDYWGTVLALPVRSAEVETVEHSKYHQRHVVRDDDRDDDDSEPAEGLRALLLRPQPSL